MLFLGGGCDSAVLTEDDEARARCALINRSDIAGHFVSPSRLDFPSFRVKLALTAAHRG
jgi:hypothetical protein